MHLRHGVRAILGVLPLLFATPGRADLEGDVDAGKRLLSQGDALADQGKGNEATLRYKQAFEQILPAMRKLPFHHEVKRDVTAREDLKALLIKEIDSEMTPAEFKAGELGMKALGLLPRDVNLKEAMVEIYSDQIAAFYDTKTKTMHLIKEPEAKAKKPLTFLERLMGKTQGFDKGENKTVISHELTHALADQNFDIDAMQTAVKHDDDRSLAVSALIEGEATLTMIGAQMEDWKGNRIRRVPASELDRTFSLMMPFMSLSGGASLREAPVILSESLIFPYFRGVVFCARLTNQGGWNALDDAYRRPPLSTEQILHPEKFRAQPDLPVEVDLGKLDPGAGWTELGRNVVGEMQLAILLRRHGGKSAAAGWDGDHFAVFEGRDGRLGLVWLSTWDSAEDAREFAQGYAAVQSTKLSAPLPGAGAGSPDGAEIDMKFVVERRGLDVAVVEGFSSDTTARLLENAFRAGKTEITYKDAAAGDKKTQKGR